MIFQIKALKAIASVYHLIAKLPTLNPLTDAEILFTTSLITSAVDTYFVISVPNTRIDHLASGVLPFSSFVPRFKGFYGTVIVGSVSNKFTCNFAARAYFHKRMLWIKELG